MIPRLRPLVQQFETHQQLVGRAMPALSRRAPRVNAIVVPASRTAASLSTAVTLADAAACELVVLCSRDANASEVTELFASQGFRRGTAVNIPTGYRLPLADFASSRLARDELPHFCQSPNGDLSVKRNIGLLLGRMLGWRGMFFMDDDIRDISADDLRATVAMLDRYRAAGMRVTDFPDNSVVCHAHRETGGPQDIFVSGSVLAVDCQQSLGFFPDIYNEDWLFFYEGARTGLLGWSGRNAKQLPYDPFAEPGRATRQEFGDVLAEGLYALLHRGAGITEATHDYWRLFLNARKKFLMDVNSRGSFASDEIRSAMTIAVDTAMHYLNQINASMCERYVRAWQRDQQYWAQVMKAVRPISSLTAAFQRLGLQPGGDIPALSPGRVAKIRPIGPAKQRPKSSDNRLLSGRHRKGSSGLRTARQATHEVNRAPFLPVTSDPHDNGVRTAAPGTFGNPDPGVLNAQAQTTGMAGLHMRTDPSWQAETNRPLESAAPEHPVALLHSGS